MKIDLKRLFRSFFTMVLICCAVATVVFLFMCLVWALVHFPVATLVALGLVVFCCC